MKKKIFITIILFIFSYYYTYKCITFLKQNDYLMQEIIDKQELYNKEPINAIITNNTMIPGVNGRKINLDESYNKMKKLNKFNDSLLSYDEIKPTIFIKDNYNKIIISGNKMKNNISIILIINEDELFYSLNKILIINNVYANILSNKKYNINNTNYINIVNTNYSSNIDYCLTYELQIKNDCITNKKYTILGRNIHNYHFTNTKEIIDNGSILVYSFNKSNYQDLNIIIKYLKNNNYNIVSIQELIKE